MKTTTNGWINGMIGVLIFSASLPATRLAVAGFDPLFLTSIRATIAALIGIVMLLALRAPRPNRFQLVPLMLVAIGVVIGFPFLTALALRHITAAYSIVFIGLLPLSTALFAVLRAKETPQPAFWVFSVFGSCLVAGFALSGGVETSVPGNAFMIAAIVICGLGYAEGAKLSRYLGGWQVISWALALALPLMAFMAFLTLPGSFEGIRPSAWFGLAYVSVFSMLVGFVFWYRGLAQGGIASVGQLQLLQPFFGLLIAATFLGEAVSGAMLAVTITVVLCVIAAKHFARS